MRAVRLRLGVLLLALALASAACGAATADGPPDIVYGRDICVQCNMIITEIGHAAAYRLDTGAEKAFDGIGEMVVYGRQEGEFSRAEAWVHDYWSEEWILAEQAFYVPTRAVSSPMGHGIFGFSNRERATVFAAEVGGEVIDWETVLALPVTDGLVRGKQDDDAENVAVADHDMTDHDMTEHDMTEHEMEGGK